MALITLHASGLRWVVERPVQNERTRSMLSKAGCCMITSSVRSIRAQSSVYLAVRQVDSTKWRCSHHKLLISQQPLDCYWQRLVSMRSAHSQARMLAQPWRAALMWESSQSVTDAACDGLRHCLRPRQLALQAAKAHAAAARARSARSCSQATQRLKHHAAHALVCEAASG
jgi:hypothetical protein